MEDFEVFNQSNSIRLVKGEIEFLANHITLAKCSLKLCWAGAVGLTSVSEQQQHLAKGRMGVQTNGILQSKRAP